MVSARILLESIRPKWLRTRCPVVIQNGEKVVGNLFALQAQILELDPGTRAKNKGRNRKGRNEGTQNRMVSRNLDSQCWGTRDRWVPGACRPASPGCLAHSRPMRGPVSKNKVESV